MFQLVMVNGFQKNTKLGKNKNIKLCKIIILGKSKK